MNSASCTRTIPIEVFEKWGKLFETHYLMIANQIINQKGRMKVQRAEWELDRSDFATSLFCNFRKVI